MPTVAFDATREESRIVRKIALRALAMAASRGVELEQLDVQMDVLAAHSNGCRLRLGDLLAADEFNFAHDVFGIVRFIDRNTGKLTGCFTPRFAVSVPGT